MGVGNISINMQDIMDDKEVQGAIYEIYLRELAFWTCVNKIANAVSKCEFKTYVKGKEVKDAEYYLWNYEPNQNQNAAGFVNKLIGKLYRNNECLVVEVNRKLYVADSYCKEIFALKDYKFSGIVIDGYELSETLEMSDVMFFELNSNDMRKLMNGMYETYSKLIVYAQEAYKKSRGKKGILNVEAIAQEDDNFNENFNQLMTEHFKNFFSKENAVLPLFDGYNYQDISDSGKTYSTESTRDIKSLADDIFEFTARGFSFPPSLAKGDVQDTSKAIDELLTFVVDPLVEMLQQEINRKRNGYKGFKQGTYIKIETLAVKHIDIFDIATPVDKLISSGAFTINDILEVLGKPKIEEEWANQHFMTKNYSKIQDLLSDLKGENAENGEN
ncbi:MAG: phage portal protein [Faecalimonas umbilicata]|uniref:phage portal protein n=1 Tax=Faecalimonas umbilicata TaxID=1912855 RepID=UPI003993DB89